MMLQPREQPLGDPVVVALAVPLRHDLSGCGIDGPRISATQMNAERDLVETGDDGIVGFDRTFHVLVRVFTPRAHAIERDLIDIGSVAWSIDLNVAAAGMNQLANDLSRDVDNFGKEGVHIGIDSGRVLPVETL